MTLQEALETGVARINWPRQAPPDELRPYDDESQIAFVLAVRILNIKGTLWHAGDFMVSGFDYVICDTNADYNVARLCGLDGQNGELITRADLLKRAIDKVW